MDLIPQLQGPTSDQLCVALALHSTEAANDAKTAGSLEDANEHHLVVKDQDTSQMHRPWVHDYNDFQLQVLG